MKAISKQDSSDEELELTQVLPITDSEDESVQYLRSVRSQATNYKHRYIESKPSSTSTSNPIIPESSLPSNFSLDLTDTQKHLILSEFTTLRDSLTVWLSLKSEESTSRKFGSKDEWHDFILKHLNPPLLEFICRFDQLTIYKLLRWHTDWLESQDLTEHISTWIYALLAGIQKPLLMETMGDINRILSKCIEKSSEDYAKILIVIISEYFGQKIGI